AAVAVEVSRCDGGRDARVLPGAVDLRRSEAAVPAAEEDRDDASEEVLERRCREVEVAVAVEVAGDDRVRLEEVEEGRLRGAEAPVAVSEEHVDVPAVVAHCEIGL